jgi:hypothetical protein
VVILDLCVAEGSPTMMAIKVSPARVLRDLWLESILVSCLEETKSELVTIPPPTTEWLKAAHVSLTNRRATLRRALSRAGVLN